VAPGGVEPPHADSKFAPAVSARFAGAEYLLLKRTFWAARSHRVSAYLGRSCYPGVAPVLGRDVELEFELLAFGEGCGRTDVPLVSFSQKWTG
jgi:hypothetical protein